jgi:hypothetical protein
MAFDHIPGPRRAIKQQDPDLPWAPSFTESRSMPRQTMCGEEELSSFKPTGGTWAAYAVSNEQRNQQDEVGRLVLIRPTQNQRLGG